MSFSQPLKIGLFWHSARSGNLGVGALSIANAHLIREAADAVGVPVDLRIFGMGEINHDYPVDPPIPTTEMGMAYLLSPRGLLADAGRLDLAIDIGAGDSFADIYSNKRVVMLLLTKLAARLRRVPLLLAPQTIGPFSKPLWKIAAARALRWADTVMTRDTRSTEAAHALAPDARIIEAVDVAFALPFTRAPRTAGEPLQVGVNVSGLLWNGADAFGLGYDYRALVRHFIADALARGATVHLVPHVNAPEYPADDDGRAIAEVAAEFPACRPVPAFDSPIAAKSFISGLDLLAAGRMHACIAALSSGVPVLPFSYSRKFEGLFGTLGYDWLVHHKGMDTQAAAALATRAFDNLDAVKHDVAAANARVAQKLDRYRAVLRDTLQRVAAARAAA